LGLLDRTILGQLVPKSLASFELLLFSARLLNLDLLGRVEDLSSCFVREGAEGDRDLVNTVYGT
jgi:hypothetical protein